MAEYIEREAAISAITTDGFEHFSGCLSSSEVRLLELMRDSISEVPAADVAEVKHGEWVEKWDSQHFVSSCICSVCGKGTHRDSLIKWAKGAYCQNCGAKMDGKEKDHE